VFKLLVAALLFALLWWQLDVATIATQLSHISLLVWGVALLLLVLGQCLSALRWYALCRSLSLRCTFAQCLRLYFIGMYISLFTPSIVGGDVIRAWMLGQQAHWRTAAVSVLLERINGVCAITLIILLAACFTPLPPLMLWAIIAGSLALWLILILSVTTHHRLPAPWRNTIPEVPRALIIYWWPALLLSLAFQCLIITCHLLLGMVAGLYLSIANYALMVCLVALLSALPVSLNGLGIREGGYVGFAVFFGASAEAAATMAILWLTLVYISALPGALLFLKSCPSIEKPPAVTPDLNSPS